MSYEGHPPNEGVSNANNNHPQLDFVLVEDVVESESEEEEEDDVPNEEEENDTIEEEENYDNDVDEAAVLSHFQGLREREQAAYIRVNEATLAVFVSRRNEGQDNADTRRMIAFITRVLAVVRPAGAAAAADEAEIPNEEEDDDGNTEYAEKLAHYRQMNELGRAALIQKLAFDEEEFSLLVEHAGEDDPARPILAAIIRQRRALERRTAAGDEEAAAAAVAVNAANNALANSMGIFRRGEQPPAQQQQPNANPFDAARDEQALVPNAAAAPEQAENGAAERGEELPAQQQENAEDDFLALFRRLHYSDRQHFTRTLEETVRWYDENPDATLAAAQVRQQLAIARQVATEQHENRPRYDPVARDAYNQVNNRILIREDQIVGQLMDEEEWLRSNSLAEEPRFGAESYNNHQEALQQQQQERQYQRHVHEKIFMEDESKGGDAYLYSTQERKKCLEQWKNESLHLKGASGKVLTANLAKIARHSQMVFSMAYSNTILHRQQDLADGEEQQEEERKDSGNSSPEQKRQRKEEEKDPQQQPKTTTSNAAVAPSLCLSLEEFSYSAVDSFLELIDSYQPANKEDEDGHPTLPTHAINRLGENDFVVDCCRIAHYLQCRCILDQLVEAILMPSIDSENCMSLCQLADQLSLARLHEASLKHILKTLDSIDDDSMSDRESNSSGENDDLINTTLPNDITAKLNTEYLTPELQRKIKHIKQILMSQSRKTIFFDTFVEYIAMLAEQYQYYKERLEEAREQQAIHEPDTRDWKYSQTKIDQQAIKVERLRNFLQEQKKVFGVGQRAK